MNILPHQTIQLLKKSDLKSCLLIHRVALSSITVILSIVSIKGS